MASVQVSNEIGQLKKVIVHEPDEGILRVSPKKSADLLFDDIVYLPAMQAEHKIFTDVLRSQIGTENVLETDRLLKEALRADLNHREKLIHSLVDYEELPKSITSLLGKKSDEELAETLITGYDKQTETVLFDPIPNFLFTRDIAVTIGEHILITKAAKQARTRENYLTRFIVYNHHLFSKSRQAGKIIDLNLIDLFPPSKKGEPVSMEGGDVMILNEEYLLVGISERTNLHAFHSLKKYLFDHQIVNNVVSFSIPADRSFMHIDTILTQFDHNHFVAYKPIIQEGISSNVEVHRISGDHFFYATMQEFLLAEISNRSQILWVGGGETPMQEREQWTDGCNLLALRPGVAIVYDRNEVTIREFASMGYTIKPAREVIDSGQILVDPTIISLPSAELSRARGGPHCMSCPIERLGI
jgi:arginine deiminase